MTQDTSVISSLDEEDLKNYLLEVLVEVGRLKKILVKKVLQKLIGKV